MESTQGGGSSLHGDLMSDCVGFEENAAVMLDIFLSDDVKVDVFFDGTIHGCSCGDDFRGKGYGLSR